MTERLSVVKAVNARLVPFDYTRVARARVLDVGYERPARERPPGRSTAGRLVTDAVRDPVAGDRRERRRGPG
jgi:hypothetical protein